MYIDFIKYRLAEGKDDAFLRQAATEIHSSWMRKQDGFLGWEIYHLGAGEYQDIVRWKSKEAAAQAEANMSQIDPNCDWYKCYDMPTVKSEKGESVATFIS